MRTIWKYTPLSFPQPMPIEMPKGARILKVGAQNENLVFWALVDPAAEKEKREFFLIGTGHKMLDAIDGATYLGSAMLNDGHLVLHLFETTAKEKG